ncbi:MAG TPA: hypothetical protein VMF08_17760, partial [Candidatus Sulfotelmatobacter sp.]|nr:hypothetical protein [Candidatus Sulfotelmatobacter sp.]
GRLAHQPRRRIDAHSLESGPPKNILTFPQFNRPFNHCHTGLVTRIRSNAHAVSGTQFAAGRSGTVEYQCSQNAISYGFGSNALTEGIEVYYTMTRQFLDMGLAETEPESVKWQGDTFTATNRNGAFQYGELSISNGLPSRLEIAAAKGSSPYKVIDYTYPNPPSSFDGFPAKMVISGESDGAFIPEVEMQFYSIHLAARPLPNNFFAATRFLTPNIVYTNIFSNSDVYAQFYNHKTAAMVKVPKSTPCDSLRWP